jgi:hypothetical protein
MKESSREILELRAEIAAIEKPRVDTELLHLDAMRELLKVNY